MGRYIINSNCLYNFLIFLGFLRTDMTADKYAHLYEKFGAVSAAEAVPFILQIIVELDLINTGKFFSSLGSQGLGLGEVSLPINLSYPTHIPPGGELPF